MKQREIKFRAWNRELKTMGSAMPLDVIVKSAAQNPQDGFDIDNVDVMQFTGLKDKNGKEIYEGDALKVTMQGDAQSSPFIVENLWDLRIAMETPDSYVRIEHDTLEVIGNIYENPELLEKV